MSTFRLALAALPVPESAEVALARAEDAIGEAARAGAELVAFPECYVPGYRWPTRSVAPPDRELLPRTVARLGEACRRAEIVAAIGTERWVDGEWRLTVMVIDGHGDLVGFQDKTQLDPDEEGLYVPAYGRRLFHAVGIPFGIVICHEGWRYPETVRWAASRGAPLVVHCSYAEATPRDVEGAFADPRKTFHEGALRSRAAENTCWFASVTCALPQSAHRDGDGETRRRRAGATAVRRAGLARRGSRSRARHAPARRAVATGAPW